MNNCILCSVIIVSLTSDACANGTNDNNLITTYDPGTPKSINFPRLPANYKEIKVDDQFQRRSKNNDHIKFEDQSPNGQIKFKDDTKDYIDEVDPSLLLADISFDNENGSNQNNRILNSILNKRESNDSKNKIKFEGSDDKQDNPDDRETFEYDEPQNDMNQVVFENDGKDKDRPDYIDESESEIKTANKPIKFENHDNKSKSNSGGLDDINVSERVVFKDDSATNQEPNRNKKRKQRRRPRYKPNTEPAQTAQNSPYPGLGQSGYPGNYPGPNYSDPGDPNAGYPGGYPTQGSPNSVHPYPNYPSLYTGTAFATPGKPGYPTYPSMYPPVGYGAYPAPGYQVQGQRPLAGPVAYPSPAAYPNPGQVAPSGQSDTRYPSQQYAGTQSSGGLPPGPEYPYYQGYPVPGYPIAPYSQYPPQNQGQYRPQLYPGAPYQGYSSGPQRPSRRPKSLTQRAVSAVAEALTSIALYDDQQCVPRILCEVAGGSSASSPTLLKASASLQPLLTLLQAYNTVSSSPLFIFGHAAVTGLAAKGKSAACQRAYPDCPSDPEKLIHYLNNHNGGFFRFFGQPQAPQQQQNLEQFYNYLSGQSGTPQQTQQNYGFPRLDGYGYLPQNYAYPYNYGQNNYNERIGYRNAKTNGSDVENNRSKVKNNESEGRIQNRPTVNAIEAEIDYDSNENYQDNDSKWSFPDDGSFNKGNGQDKVLQRPERQRERPSRGSKTLKFPDDRSDDRRETHMIRDHRRQHKHIFFPEQSNYQIKYTNYQTTTPVNLEEYYFDRKHNFYVKRPKALKTDDVVYVVRGNGDPKYPEIVRVRPGQNI